MNIKAKEANKDFDEDGDELNSPWDKMCHDGLINTFEWENGVFSNPNSYCVRLWNPNNEKFECNCAELGLGIDHGFIF